MPPIPSQNKKKYLENAIKTNNYAQVDSLIKKSKFDINKIIDRSGKTYLMLACDKSNRFNTDTPPRSEMIKLLLKNGANVDVSTTDNTTIFMYAAQHDNAEILKLLISHIPQKNIEMPKNMLSEYTTWMTNTNIDQSMQQSMLQSMRQSMRQSIRSIRQKKIRELLNKTNNNGDSALHFACVSNKYHECVKMLLKHGANVDNYNNPPSDTPRTPLMYSCIYDDIKSVKELLKYHANMENIDEYGRTPVMLACRNSAFEIVSTLIKRNAIVTTLDNSDINLLMIACEHGKIEIVQQLLTHKTQQQDLKLKNSEGHTAIMIADENNHTDIVQLLTPLTPITD